MADARKKSSGRQTGRKNTGSAAKKGTAAKKNTAKNAKKDAARENVRREVLLLSCLAVSILLMLSNFGLGGFVGGIVCDFFFGIFGLSEWIFPILLFAGTAFIMANRRSVLLVRKTVGAFFCFWLFCAFLQLLTAGYSADTRILDYFRDCAYDHLGGGLFGGLLVMALGAAFGKIGAYVIVVIGIVIAAVIMTQRPIMTPLRDSGNEAYARARARREARLARTKTGPSANQETTGRREEPAPEAGAESPGEESLSIQRGVTQKPDAGEEGGAPAKETFGHGKPEQPQEGAKRTSARKPRTPKAELAAETADIRQEISGNAQGEKPVYHFPPISLLKKSDRTIVGDSDEHLREVAHKLEDTLESFGVRVMVNNVSCGPTVTRYELLPEQGVKVSRIVSLTDDIKLSLAAADIRIEAPIPGKSAVGIEVPNATNTTVMLRDLLETPEFRNHPSCLAFAAGMDIAGKPVIADIAKMPHLLIAGATGSGKSVCINTLIMSILYKANPEEVKLIMIDPKVVELSVYNGIPHLFIPVVTDPKKASGALNWAVAEMDDRYRKFAEEGVRDIRGYNEKIARQPAGEDGEKPSPMPKIVIIVDELADLMMVAPGEVEDSICRLAQLARAAGIHLIIATQRPSVNVITGLIKANMPSRIAFSVSSGVDSRTILDSYGAEKLLGKGDMLYKPQDYQKAARVQGSFVSDGEVSGVVAYLKDQYGEAGYDPVVAKKVQSASAETASGGAAADDARDGYFADAGRFIIEKDKASIGMLQRAFKIGFNRAARIMDQLCDAGVVGAEEGTKPRKVLMSMEEFEAYLEEYV